MGSALNAVSIVMGFLTIVCGVALLFQYSVKLRRLAVRGDARHRHSPSYMQDQLHAAIQANNDRLDLSVSLSRDAMLRKGTEGSKAVSPGTDSTTSIWHNMLKSK